MTVCIAAICHDDEGPKIIVCADTKLSSTYSGSSEGGTKVTHIGHGWAAMIAGDDIGAAEDLRDSIKSKLLSRSAPTGKTKLHAVLTRVAMQFSKKPLYKAKNIDVIVAGFIQGNPVLSTVRIDAAGNVTVQFSPAFCAIGSGGVIAEVLLNLRDVGPGDSIFRSLYVVYEAKKYAEKDPHVGADTAIYALSPSPAGLAPNNIRAFALLADDLVALEDMRSKYGLQDIATLPVKIPPARKEGLGLGLDLAAALIPGEGLIAAGAHAVIDVASTFNAAAKNRDAAAALGSVVSFQVGALEQAAKGTSWGAVRAIPAVGQFVSGALAFYDVANAAQEFHGCLTGAR